ncbi:MAG TPA: hypothetical protein P5218_11250, partial [Planctomycetota bacterium]|nr:hypothetical protein [Planctomycetota bacterium]
MPTPRPALGVALAVLVLFGILPLAMMSTRLGVDPSALGLLGEPRILDLLGRTLLLGLGVAPGAWSNTVLL